MADPNQAQLAALLALLGASSCAMTLIVLTIHYSFPARKTPSGGSTQQYIYTASIGLWIT
jgi:hypothetical protein